MFKKFKDSPYVKATAALVVGGGLLILFHNWIANNKISLGFETVNSTLAPVYIGVILSFIVCPVYNACVRFFYRRILSNAQMRGFSIGPTLVHDDRHPVNVDSQERGSILTAARALSTVICVILVAGLLGLLMYFVVPQLVQTVIGLVNTLPQRLDALSLWLTTHLKHFPVLTRWIDNVANAGMEDVLKWTQDHVLEGNAMNIANMVSSGVATAVTYVLNAVIGLLIMVYLLNYKERLFAICRKFVAATCGQKKKDSLYEFADIVNETFIGFIVGRIIDSFIIGVLTYIALKLFDIPFALMISVIVGITNIIPFFGPFIGAVPSVLLLMLEDPKEALYFILIILVIQQLDGNVIGPKIVGNAIGMSSFWVLLAVLIGGGLFGFAGMAFGVPVFAVIYRYVDKLITRQLKYKEKATETSDYFSLEPFGIDADEVAIDADNRPQGSVLKRLKMRKSEGGLLPKRPDRINRADGDGEELKEAIAKEKPSGEVRKVSPKVSTHDKK